MLSLAWHHYFEHDTWRISLWALSCGVEVIIRSHHQHHYEIKYHAFYCSALESCDKDNHNNHHDGQDHGAWESLLTQS
jgi:hypothetical protein